MVREYHKLPPGPPSPVLPSEPPQQEVRGPAGGGEVGSQCDNPTQQQVLTGGPAGWDPPHFPSTDVRMRRSQEKLSPSSLVRIFTRLCHQKPGGGYKGPQIFGSAFCPFCNQGSTCLGKFCKGREKPSGRKAVESRNQGFQIPGLDRSNDFASSAVLTNRTFTSTKKLKVTPLSPNSPIFHPIPKKPSQPTSSHSFKTSSTKTSKPKSKPKLFTPGWYEENKHLQKKLRTILLHTSLKSQKSRKQQKKKKSENSHCNSSMRKLSISEVSCTKKTSQVFFQLQPNPQFTSD